ncbi:efflux RND transporter permease subunit [Parapusillimonas granuli]|uniref:Efflux RND transporter permease subunit n=1 Tax=Parapusillimonas granuli TaxID=380911 RepID=A0A853FWR2_9BURK|nr:efflux RND transporter permease subunit [Parapusillimonas granuli]MBB5213725.1 multidrug efflux pump subunit AcrB [Parapusillimonas granuli]NYT48559.1 efflux RND transporter permease subunit [Parapusillimonas granuli]
MMNTQSAAAMGVSGRIAAFFQQAQITPLLALLALLLGLFAVAVTPREEEPQINVTMANVLIPFPGAAVRDVEQMVAVPAEQVLSQILDVEHVMSVSHPGLAVLTVQFEVGVTRTEALVRLYDTIHSNADWLPKGLGVLDPIVKPKGIDDVPIVTLTLFSKNPSSGAFDLERVAHSVETDLKRVPGTREVTTIGGPGRAVMVEIDPVRMNGAGITAAEIRQALLSANLGLPVGELLVGNRSMAIESGPFLRHAHEVADLVIGVRDGKPVFLRDVASVRDGPPPPSRYVWHGVAGKDGAAPAEYPAVTIAVTKKAGENAIDVADAVMKRVDDLRNTVIPGDVEVAETRNYGASANDKAQTLMQKLLFATASVVALVFFALGRREAAIVGSAVVLTLTVTLFASWAWGFTLNRVSLFALIFSIGILVDDAIVVVENIHRHQQLYPGKPLAAIIPGAVDEVGGPTILATLTVIAALLPMAFVTGLMGPYMSPIPINASMGMLLSLAIAFVVTPWLARLWMKPAPAAAHGPGAHAGVAARIAPAFERIFRPLLDERRGGRNRALLGLGVALLIAASLALPATGLVLLKMLPFDNKSEFQVVVDMPAGTPVEQTAAVLHELGGYLATVPEVTDYQAYAGTAAPINFNGLVRQYYLRTGGSVGDLQVNLVGKSARKDQSHAIATRLRPELQKIGARYGANVKVVEVPPGPPVLSPIVAEIYGPEASGRLQVAKAVRAVFERTPGVVDVDDSSIAAAPKTMLLVDRQKASMLGVPQQAIVSTLRAGLAGEATAYLHDESKYPAAAVLQLPPELHGDLDALLQLTVRSADGKLVPIRELVTLRDQLIEQPVYRKDLLPVNFVVADMAGALDSPLYGMFEMRGELAGIATPGGGTLQEYFIRQPDDAYRDYALKWDGEWQITYETFRDMGLAYGVGLVLIYLLVVAHFASYLTPLIIMAPIPLTIIGVMPGHALLGAQYTATSMIGMIALAGIIVRNSILLVDFIKLQLRDGVDFKEAIVRSAITRAQPIVLTGLAAMLGAFFILDDPIFNGLAISLIFGIFVSTVLTLVVIPILYFAAYRNRLDAILQHDEPKESAAPSLPLSPKGENP